MSTFSVYGTSPAESLRLTRTDQSPGSRGLKVWITDCGLLACESGAAGVDVPGRNTSRSSAERSGGAHCSRNTTRCADGSTWMVVAALGPEPVIVPRTFVASETVLPLRMLTSVEANVSNIVFALVTRYDTPEVCREMFVSRLASTASGM